MGRRAVILQSNYIPWKGYFDLVHDADVFVFDDDVQYTHGDWRNRNRIKTHHGVRWLTIPTGRARSRKIEEVLFADMGWAEIHWRTLQHTYARAPRFPDYERFFREFYLRSWTGLSEFNQSLIQAVSTELLGIDTVFDQSSRYPSSATGQERLIQLLKAVEASSYISGPTAKAYVDEERFREEGIELIWKDYAGYPEYDQPYPPFCHEVTILDLLSCTGPEAAYYIWGWREHVAGIRP